VVKAVEEVIVLVEGGRRPSGIIALFSYLSSAFGKIRQRWNLRFSSLRRKTANFLFLGFRDAYGVFV